MACVDMCIATIDKRDKDSIRRRYKYASTTRRSSFEGYLCVGQSGFLLFIFIIPFGNGCGEEGKRWTMFNIGVKAEGRAKLCMRRMVFG